ncbi:MAG: A24 family peptidase [Propioniciclava sp.]|uniref:prepilin peptidase n=1 Tax=Propioniciclava sp. TaxID=2038686 RepID=UPI0039E5FA00
MMAVTGAGFLVGLIAGMGADVWLRRRRYRYDDERDLRLLNTGWLIAVLPFAVGLIVAGWWQLSIPTAILLSGYCIVLGVLAAIDLDVRRLPDAITLPLIPVTLAGVVVVAVMENALGDAWRAVQAGLALGAFYFVQVLIGRGAGMGLGDAKLAVSLGLACGLLSWPHVFVSTLAAYLSALLLGGILMLARRAGRKTEIAFGPHMALGAAIVFCAPGAFALVTGALG